jgi:hypothetical protein
MAERKIERCIVSYYDEERTPDTVLVGGWEIVLAERKFGLANEHPMEYAMYLGYLGAKRAGLTGEAKFDDWAHDVALVENADAADSEDGTPGESPAPPGT